MVLNVREFDFKKKLNFEALEDNVKSLLKLGSSLQ